MSEVLIKAIELLGHENIGVRIGAIYALERIAQDSSRDHWPVMEGLAGYLRSREQKIVRDGEYTKRIWDTDDVLAILTVFSRRKTEFEGKNNKLNLSGVRFTSLDLTKIGKSIGLEKAMLSGADFSGSILTGMNLSGADLSSARMSGAKLQRANLSETIMEGTKLDGADLTGAILSKAVLHNVSVFRANFSDTDLSEACISELYYPTPGKMPTNADGKTPVDKEDLIGIIGLD